MALGMINLKEYINDMKRLSSVCLAAFILLGCVLVTSPAAAGEVKIISPANNSLIYSRNPLVHVIVKLTDGNDVGRLGLKSAADNQSFDPLGKWENGGSYYVHYSVPMKVGQNTFRLEPGGTELIIKFKPLRSLLNVDFTDKDVFQFHRTENVPAECGACHTDKLPADFAVDRNLFGQFSPSCYSCHTQTIVEAKWKHSPTANLFCRSCHQAEGKSNISIPTGRVEKLCYRCHVNEREWEKMSHIHGPVGTGDCTICHDPHGERNRFQLWTDGKANICVACHADKKKYLNNDNQRFYVHGILSARGCVACHSPHATDYRFQLFSNINELCSSCHTLVQGLTTGHPVQNHPVSGEADPRRPGYPFTCTSCHNPHGSGFQHLLIGDLRGGDVCGKCHGDQVKSVPGQ